MAASFYLASLVGTAATDGVMAVTGVMRHWTEVLNAPIDQATLLLQQAALGVLEPIPLGVTLLALGMLSWDVVLRMWITERPPIKNLYDTFLFIAAVGVLLAVIAELVLPRRIALAAAPFLGALLVMFARMFEVADGADTMNPLVAVLDSNFWLATHVTTINSGYAAAVVAALRASDIVAVDIGGIYADLSLSASENIYAAYTAETGKVLRNDGGTDEVFGIEGVLGTGYEDILAGDDLENYLAAGAGDDILAGEGGSDELLGGEASAKGAIMYEVVPEGTRVTWVDRGSLGDGPILRMFHPMMEATLTKGFGDHLDLLAERVGTRGE